MEKLDKQFDLNWVTDLHWRWTLSNGRPRRIQCRQRVLIIKRLSSEKFNFLQIVWRRTPTTKSDGIEMQSSNRLDSKTKHAQKGSLRSFQEAISKARIGDKVWLEIDSYSSQRLWLTVLMSSINHFHTRAADRTLLINVFALKRCLTWSPECVRVVWLINSTGVLYWKKSLLFPIKILRFYRWITLINVH